MSILNAITSGAGGVALSGDTSGNLIIQSAGTNVVTFTSTGMVTNVGAPAFFAYKSANSGVISNSTYTKVTFDSEAFDTNNNFASSTFTPTVAGYYQVNGSISLNAQNVNPTFGMSSIYKNGAQYVSSWVTGNASSLVNAQVSAVIYMNGTTDYLELYGRLDGATNGIWQGGGTNATNFNACLVRSA
jgi:hypothetical protein